MMEAHGARNGDARQRPGKHVPIGDQRSQVRAAISTSRSAITWRSLPSRGSHCGSSATSRTVTCANAFRSRYSRSAPSAAATGTFAVAGAEPQVQARGRRLDDLEAVHARLLLDHRRQRDRYEAHERSVAGRERHDVVAAAFDFDRRQRAAARARRRLHAHAIAQVVANDRLQVIGEIGQQHRVRQLAGRGRPVIAIHGFQDHPVRVHVQDAFAAAVADGQAFGGAVLVEQRASERGLDRRMRRPRQHFAAGPQARGPQLQPARLLLVGEERQHRRITGDERRPIGVQRCDQIGQRGRHREALHVEPRLAARDAPPRGDAREMIAVGGDQRGASALRGCRRPIAAREGGPQQLRGHQRVVRGQRRVVLHEHAGRAHRAGAGPHQIAVAKALADVGARADERLDVAPPDFGIGAPGIESGHQRRLGDDRQVGKLRRARGNVAPQVAVERRVGARVPEERGAALPAGGGDGRGAEEARPCDLRRERADRPLREGGTDRIRERPRQIQCHEATPAR